MPQVVPFLIAGWGNFRLPRTDLPACPANYAKALLDALNARQILSRLRLVHEKRFPPAERERSQRRIHNLAMR